MSKLAQFRVQVTLIEDTGKPQDDSDFVDVLDVRVQVEAEFVPSSGYGAAKQDGAPEPLALQQQIRAALEAARPGNA